jgi:hypothetical protein
VNFYCNGLLYLVGFEFKPSVESCLIPDWLVLAGKTIPAALNCFLIVGLGGTQWWAKLQLLRYKDTELVIFLQ